MIYLGLIFIFLLFIIFFTSTEIALISSNPIKMRHRAKMGDRRAKRLLVFFSHPEDYVATILVGTNLFVVAMTVIATRAFSYYWGVTGKVLTTFIVSAIILLFGEITPKSIARIHANSIASRNFSVLQVFHILFFPLSWIVRSISRLLLIRTNGGKTGLFKEEISRENLKWALNRAPGGESLKKIDKRIFTRIFQFAEKPVGEIMIPRVEIKMLSYPFKVKEALRMAEMTGFSRFPVYKKQTDVIIGMVTVKDLFARDTRKISDMIRPVKFIPPNKRCDALLTELKNEESQMAVVVNEFGETEGMVTLEDLVEELFGDIADEFDMGLREQTLREIAKNRFLIDGLARIAELNEQLPVHIPEGNYDTISGFIMDRLKELPLEEKTVEEQGFRITVKEMEGQKIRKVVLRVVSMDGRKGGGTGQ
jgi:CBS domain containing-hemolysin-like protein